MDLDCAHDVPFDAAEMSSIITPIGVAVTAEE
jgi:hypothetical protein